MKMERDDDGKKAKTGETETVIGSAGKDSYFSDVLFKDLPLSEQT